MNLYYILAGLVRRQVPIAVLFHIMKLRGDANFAEAQPDDYFRSWHAQLSQSGLSLRGCHVVEIGSGRYARLALRMLAAGARRVTLIDFYALPLNHPAQQALLAADCARLGIDWADAQARIDVITADILAPELAQLDEPADLVLSSAVLEHVRDPRAILARCANWLRSGGATYHMVDLRDHNFHFRYPFEMLTFSEYTWHRWLNLRGGFHVNRWRVPDFLRALADAGLVDITYETLERDDEALETVADRLNARFQAIPRPVLAIQLINLYGRKPGAGNA